jgi:Flp pilus assembly protein TadD
MVNGGEQKPAAVMGPRARGRGRRPKTGQRLLYSAGRRSSAGYVAAGLAVLALAGAWSLGLAGCTAGGPGYGRMGDASGSALAKMRQSPGEISRLRGNAHYYKLMGQAELGLREMELAHQQNPDNLEIANLLAQHYEELGKFEAARQLYQEALTRHGSHPVIVNNLGFSYYQEGRWQEAEACFRQALDHDAGNVAARNNLGLLYCRLGRQNEARLLWQNAEGAAAADLKIGQALAALGMPARPVYAQRTESGPPVTEATLASAPKSVVSPVQNPAPVRENTLAKAATPKVSTPPPPRPAPVATRPRPEPVKLTSAASGMPARPVYAQRTESGPPVTEATLASAPKTVVSPAPSPAPVRETTLAKAATPKVSTPSPPRPAPVATRPRPEPVKLTSPDPAKVIGGQAPAKANSQAQKVQPKKLEPRLATTPPAKASGPVAAKPRKEALKRVAVSKPARPEVKANSAAPGAIVAPVAAANPAAVPPPIQPRTPKRSKQQVAQSPAARTPGQGKALPPSNILQAVDSACWTSLVEAAVLFYPKYLTCAELVTTAIEVRNGTRTRHLARQARSLLDQEGFTVAKIGNHVDFGAAKTIIYYRPGVERVARVLAGVFFPGAGLEPSQKLKEGMDVKILLGADLLQRPQLMARLVAEAR